MHDEAKAEVERRKAANPAFCLCGCGAEVPRRFFVPGHDAKLASALLRASREAKPEAEPKPKRTRKPKPAPEPQPTEAAA